MENTSPIIGLVNNVALLLALGVLYDVVGYRPRGAKRTIQQIIAGVTLGAISIAVMLNPWLLAPGVIFDTRSVLLSVSGLFFGTLPTLLATLMTGAFRLYLGGTGMWTGVAVSVTSGAIGVAWRHLRRRQLEDMPIGELYAMGLIVHIAMLLWMFSLPWPLPLDVLPKISLPVIAIYPVGTALLGWLMANRGARYRTDEALRESEERYRLLFDSAPDAVILFDAEGFIVNCNPGAVRGVGKESLVGKHVTEILPPELVSSLGEQLPAAQQRGYLDGEMQLARSDDEVAHIWYTAVPITDADGILSGLLVYGRDITKRKWTEEALRESEEKYRTLFETMVQGVVYQNADGYIFSANRAAERILGLTLDQMQGRTSTDPRWRAIHEDGSDFPGDTHPAMVALATGKEVLNVVMGVFNPDLEDYTWININAVPRFRPGETEPYQVYTTFEDITERKQAEEQTERALRHQAVVKQLAISLGAAFDLDTVYRTAYECVRGMMDCGAFIVSSYDRETDLIHAGYVVTRGTVRDTAGFPPIPLEKEGYGTQSRVIRTGEPLYVPDHQQSMVATETKYKIDEEGEITPGAPPEEEEDSTRSALYVPMKIEGQTVGVMQVQSNRLDGYDEEDRNLLSALANVTAVAVLNTRLFESLRRSNQELEAQRANLEELVARRTTDLNEQMGETEQLNRALANLLEDIQVANRGLEQATQQLEQANEELESFSYSVSHDLRAPLRAIDGFSRILEDEYAPELAPEAQRYLDLVRNNAQQMGQLIDDLLAFSRLSRRSLDKQSVSPTDLVRQVLEELAYVYEDRRVEISVGELPECQADPSLLKQVYVNLLSNALKYTRERETARIEVGSQPLESGETAYFVKDNGVGFDMRYADKLFGVFQRFHRAEDYEGTGVGLAIVQRIIRRHGGRVWAEAEVDKGAAFYFTI